MTYGARGWQPSKRSPKRKHTREIRKTKPLRSKKSKSFRSFKNMAASMQIFRKNTLIRRSNNENEILRTKCSQRNRSKKMETWIAFVWFRFFS